MAVDVGDTVCRLDFSRRSIQFLPVWVDFRASRFPSTSRTPLASWWVLMVITTFETRHQWFLPVVVGNEAVSTS
jgi:hypothetical protein